MPYENRRIVWSMNLATWFRRALQSSVKGNASIKGLAPSGTGLSHPGRVYLYVPPQGDFEKGQYELNKTNRLSTQNKKWRDGMKKLADCINSPAGYPCLFDFESTFCGDSTGLGCIYASQGGAATCAATASTRATQWRFGQP